MKFRSLFLSAMSMLAVTALSTACTEEKDEPAGAPSIELGAASLDFDIEAGTKTVTVTANRDWKVTIPTDANWLTVDPKSGEGNGKATEVSISVLANDSYNRSASLVFTIGFDEKKLDVIQKGNGEAEDAIETITCAEFIKRADTETDYRLVGTVTSSVNTQYCSFDMNDGTGTVVVWTVNNKDEWADVVKQGGTVTVRGKYQLYTTNSGTTKHEMVDAYIEAFEPAEEEDISKVQQITCAEFIEKADPLTTYRLEGTVTSSVNTDYCSFDMNDGTGTVVVWTVNNKDEWADVVKQGGTVTVRGKYYLYTSSTTGETKHEMIDAYIEDFKEAEVEAPAEMSIAEFIASPVGKPAILGGTVVAAYARGFMLSDGTDYVLVYDGSTSPAKEGDKVTVTGQRAEYSALPQIAKLADADALGVEILSGGNSFTLPEPKVLTGAELDAYTNTVTELVSFEGQLIKDGNYYNIIVPGASVRKGGAQYPSEALGIDSFVDANVKVTGFVSAIQSSFLNLMVTSIEVSSEPYMNVSGTELKAGASDTEVSFDITSNVDWTVSTDNPAYTVEPASGNGDATVTVKFAENAGETATVKITVATTAEVAVPSYEIVLTHTGADVAPSLNLTFPTEDQVKISAYDKTWDASISGFTWEIANFNNNNNGWNYIKCGRKSDPSVAHIATKTPIAYPVAKVVVTVDALSKTDKIKEVYLLVSSKEDYSDTLEKVNVTLAKGENVFSVSSPVADAYYKLVFDCDVAGANGIIQISKVEYAAE
ncbi:MAG: BACON domain-containing protein [Candidatus Cryptobacteroides sp.]